LNVAAEDKTTGIKNTIQIKNDKGRLSQDEIDALLKEAEKYKADDQRHKERISAKNTLENYAYTVRSSIKDENVSNQISSDDKQSVESAVNSTIEWLESNPNAEKDDLETNHKDLSSKCDAILAKLQQPATSEPSGASAGNNSQPKIEEVD